MLFTAAVSAAAAAVYLLAVLGPGLSHPAEANSEPGSSVCSHCFYRQTPPHEASAGPTPLLLPLCHTLPGGQAFATLSRPTCDTAVYSAYHLSHGWEEGEPVTEEEEDNIKVAVPALLRGGGDHVSPTDSPLQHWDSTVTTLVQSSIFPQCSTLGGDLYILTGAGGLGWAAEDGDEECQEKPLWSAVCCAIPEGNRGFRSFSLGLIKETGEGERQVSVEELEETLGGAVLFSGGCGGAHGEAVGITVGLHSEGHAGNIETRGADLTGESTEDEDEDEDSNTAGEDGKEEEEEEAGSVRTSPDSNEDTEESKEARIAAHRVAAVDEQPEESDVADLTQDSSADAATTSERSHEEQGDVTQRRAAKQQSPDSPAGSETVDEQETDTNSSSILVSVLSAFVSIVKAPLRPVFSRITQFPGQVTYVLQEDVGVLCSLPGDTFSLFHLLTSDLLSCMGRAGEILLCAGETLVFSTYYCISSILGALLGSFHIGFTGMGTLAGDTVGVFSDAFDITWWVTKLFGGRLWEQSEGYVGTVMSEMGGQAITVGEGCGWLVWRSGNGVVNVFRQGVGFIIGTLDMVFGAMRVVSGQKSE